MFQIREGKVNRKDSVKTLVSTYLEYFFSTALFLRAIQSSRVTQAHECVGSGSQVGASMLRNLALF